MRKIIFLEMLFGFQLLGFCQDGSLFTPQNRKAFADFLFCEKDYLRASDEYAAANTTAKNDSVTYNIGLCFLKMNNFEKAEEIFLSLKNSSLCEESKLLLLKISYLQNRNIFTHADTASLHFENPEYKTASRKLLLAAQIKAGMMNRIFPTENILEKNDWQALYIFEQEFFQSGRKSPTVAALFSAVVPGAGKIYTKNYGDGITSLLVTGLFSFLSYDNFNANHKTRGWIFAGLSAFFYSGNIYGSYVSARNYNLEKEEELNENFESYLSSKNYFIPEEIEGKCK